MISEIQNAVIKDGDNALRYYTEKFDGVKITGIAAPKSGKSVSKEYISALKRAKKNIEAFHRQQLPKNWRKKNGDTWFGLQWSAISSVGLYVPGGRAVYPSTVLMNAIPAKLAGVERIVMVTPPQPDGSIPAAILAAAELCGINEIYRVGGAQAIFALAYGTKTIRKVDKIVGPGNKYVTAAKQMVFGTVGIDKPAGPSEVCVYIKEGKYAAFAAAEMLAQMEHDPDAIAIAVSEKKDVLAKVQTELNKQLPNCKRKAIIEQSMKNTRLIASNDPVKTMNEIASEHLVLMVDDYEKLLPKIKHAGAIFCGPYTPVTLGDYIAGPNHVLPTAGAARFSSPLGVWDFVKASTVLHYSKSALQRLSSDIALLTDMEGLDAHHLAVKHRL